VRVYANAIRASGRDRDIAPNPVAHEIVSVEVLLQVSDADPFKRSIQK
jgi:hypothetical protein